jgi:hypothetical protein
MNISQGSVWSELNKNNSACSTSQVNLLQLHPYVTSALYKIYDVQREAKFNFVMQIKERS